MIHRPGNGADEIRIQTDKAADAELRIKMCKAEIETVLAKYELGLVYKETKYNGQVIAAEWILAAHQAAR